MLLYIAEKPSTMILVKKAYERSNKPCGDITFVALAGHVCGLMEPKEYSQWNLKWNWYVWRMFIFDYIGFIYVRF